MSKILEALEKAHGESPGRKERGPALAERAGLFSLPSITRSLTLRRSALVRAGWVSALPSPPESARPYAALAQHLAPSVEGGGRVLVCGASRGAGATTTSLNLAAAFSSSVHRPVLWCGADGESDNLRRLLGRACRYGLADHLRREVPLREVLLRTHVPRLELVPARGWQSPPTAPLAVEEVARFVDETVERRPDRLVVLDGPPVADSPLPAALAARFEATVLVVAAGTEEAVVAEARDALGAAARCTVLLNRVPRRRLH